jgi:predicted amidohydrolase
VLPELSVPGYTTDPDVLRRSAEGVPGPTTDVLTDLARQSGAVIVVGLAEVAGGSIFNAAVAITSDGIVGHYRKLHLFDGEKQSFTPGDLGLPVADTPFGRIGLCVCYDLRFPEVARILALRNAELICAPAAWVHGFDQTERELPGQVQGVIVQANLNQTFIACTSQVGTPGPLRFLGSSVLVDPFGEVCLGPMSSEHAEIAYTDIDLDLCRTALRRSPTITPRDDRRTDVYGICYDGELL